MPHNGRSSDFDQMVEDLLAEMLNGRDSLTKLERLFLANQKYGNLSTEDSHMLLEETDRVRRAVQNGLRLGRLVRSPPPDLEAFTRMLEEWTEERAEERAPGRQAKRPNSR